MPDAPAPLDGITPPAPMPSPPAADAAVSAAVQRWMRILSLCCGTFYGAYVLWSIALLVLLPNPEGKLRGLVSTGFLVALIAGAVFLGVGAIGFLRIRDTSAPLYARRIALIRLGLIAIPGLLLSVAVPLLIRREPALVLDIVKPARGEELIAPVAVTFSIERAVTTLGNRGLRTMQYKWDLFGDGKKLQETVVPTLTATFEREGIYPVSVVMILSNGASRRAVRRLVIRQAIFTASPSPPIVDRPVVFSVKNLVDQKMITEVQWDFDGDGKTDETGTTPEASTTYYRTGPYTVSALISLNNRTQTRYERNITVEEPPPLPFPVKLYTEPKVLISPPPFGVLFRIETEEPTAQVLWDFGDGVKDEGVRTAHTYDKRGTFSAEARVRSLSGAIANLSAIVRVVEPLQLLNLAFDGEPAYTGGDRIEGELPFTIHLTPRTTTPFVEFTWEAPEATEVGSTEGALQAIYRREGTYTLTLIARDLEDHVLRKTITVIVRPPQSALSIRMDPETGLAPLRVRFDASETFIPDETISGFAWDFGDSGKQVGGARVDHLYVTPGTYIVELSARTTSGKEFKTTKTIVVREPLLAACVLPSRTNGAVPLGVQFDSSCTSGNPVSFAWDFGDGARSDERNPVHVFERAGVYTVTLTIADATGRRHSQSVTITAQ